MRRETIYIAVFLGFISKETYSAEVVVADIPDEFIPVSDHDYFYNDYDTNLPPEIVVSQPRTKVKLNHRQTHKYYCQRFGSMFGIPPDKHKCGFITVERDNRNIFDEIFTKQINKRQLNSKQSKFSQDYVDNFWRFGGETSDCSVNDFINNRCELKSDELEQLETNLFSDSKPDTGYDFYRIARAEIDTPPCSMSDFINNKCSQPDNLNQLETIRLSDSKLYKDSNKKPTSAKTFSQDYVDDFLRIVSAKDNLLPCSVNDIINNGCNINSDDLNLFKTRKNSDSNLDKETNEKPTTSAKDISQEHAVDSFEITSNEIERLPCSVNDIINDECNPNSDNLNILKSHLSGSNLDTEINKRPAEFSQDYADDFWETKRTINKCCTINDIINNKCEFNSKDLIQFLKYEREKSNERTKKKPTHTTKEHKPLYSLDYVDYARGKENPNPTSTETKYLAKLFIKSKPKEIDTLRRSNFIQFRPNQFRNRIRSRYSDSSAEKSESEEKHFKEKPKRFQIVKNKKRKIKRKKPKKESSDSDIDSSEKIDSNEDSAEAKSSVEKTKKRDVKSDSDAENALSEINTSDSFETGPKKLSERYEYLQGHRIVKPKAIKTRRASRLQTFLPKRYQWKLEDIHNLGYYWFEGPKGAFPSENL